MLPKIALEYAESNAFELSQPAWKLIYHLHATTLRLISTALRSVHRQLLSCYYLLGRLLEILQNHMRALLSNRIHRRLKMRAYLQRHDARVHNPQSFNTIYT